MIDALIKLMKSSPNYSLLGDTIMKWLKEINLYAKI